MISSLLLDLFRVSFQYYVEEDVSEEKSVEMDSVVNNLLWMLPMRLLSTETSVLDRLLTQYMVRTVCDQANRHLLLSRHKLHFKLNDHIGAISTPSDYFNVRMLEAVVVRELLVRSGVSKEWYMRYVQCVTRQREVLEVFGVLGESVRGDITNNVAYVLPQVIP
jgi:hypothetical protein